MKQFSAKLVEAWANFQGIGHPMEVGRDFHDHVLPGLLARFNEARGTELEPMPWLAALVCFSPFEIALHNAFGHAVRRPVYETYGPEFMNRDLADFLAPAEGTAVSFAGNIAAIFS